MANAIALPDPITQSKMLAASSLVPDVYRNKPENVYLCLMLGDALGIHPAQALTSIQVIQGKPTMSAELMRALVQRAGHKFRIDVSSDTECVVTVARKEWPLDEQQFAFTIKDAEVAGLAGSANYKKHPKAMLLARVSTMACRAVFADVIAGISYEPDELLPAPAVQDDPWNKPHPAPQQIEEAVVIVEAAIEAVEEQPSEVRIETPTLDAIDAEAVRQEAFTLLRQAGHKGRDQMVAFVAKVLGRNPEDITVGSLEAHDYEMVVNALKDGAA